MKTILAIFLFIAGIAGAGPLVYEGTEGPGKGRHIVFLAGDHEYRSEESLPALARLLAKHHGFKCTVLFDLDGEGNIIAGEGSNMPGMEALDTADLAVVFLRFQNFPVERMKHFDAYLNRGGPVIGLRTATHAFKTPKDDAFAKYSFDSKVAGYELGFGHQVLGQTWVGHYGQNHRQSTRISIVDAMAQHPILRGVKEVWVQAGCYVGKPTDGDILTTARPLNGMTPDSPVDATKQPQASEWTRTYKSASGKMGRAFTSLYGTPEDLTNEGYRRMIVNSVFWALGQEAAIKPDLNIAFVGPFKPNTFNAAGHARGVKPEMYAGFESPIPANNTTKKPAAPAEKKPALKVEAAPDAPAVKKDQPQAATGKPARFVRIELPGDKRILTLAEVEVISGGMNMARDGKATQSSTHGDAVAARAIDGNKDSDFNKKGQTHTVNVGSTNPWWELDLGQAVEVEKIQIWNRRGFEGRIHGFTLTLLDADRKEVFRAADVPAAESAAIDVKDQGKLAYFNYAGQPAQPAARAQAATAEQKNAQRLPAGAKRVGATAIPSFVGGARGGIGAIPGSVATKIPGFWGKARSMSPAWRIGLPAAAGFGAGSWTGGQVGHQTGEVEGTGRTLQEVANYGQNYMQNNKLKTLGAGFANLFGMQPTPNPLRTPSRADSVRHPQKQFPSSKGNVWFTCIPNLWLLRDTRGTGKADFRQSLHRGFGVRLGYLGHDRPPHSPTPIPVLPVHGAAGAKANS